MSARRFPRPLGFLGVCCLGAAPLSGVSLELVRLPGAGELVSWGLCLAGAGFVLLSLTVER
jgi:hypothetical protein